MLTPINSKVAQKIRKLIPLASLSQSRFNALIAKIQLLDLEVGDFLFQKGDVTPVLVYLLEGQVSLQALGMQVEIVAAESQAALFALAHQFPRKVDAVALTPVQCINLPAEMLTESAFEHKVIEKMEKIEETGDDWMTALLKSPVFKRLPPANLQKILTGLQEVNVSKDTVIVSQGEAGEFYYLVKQGQCVVSRKPNLHAREIILAQLRAGDMFGEDALLAEQPVSASITALTPVTLLRLSKAEFLSLIKEPTLKYIQAADLDLELQMGSLIVDVRSEEAFALGHIAGSQCIPFFSLRMQLQLKVLDRNKSIIVVCEDGKLSRAAAFLLLRYKVAAKILNHGLQGLDGVESKVWSLTDSANNVATQLAATQHEAHAAIKTADVNVLLENELTALKQKYAEVLQEKQLLEKNYRILFKQTEKLKEVLSKYTANQSIDS